LFYARDMFLKKIEQIKTMQIEYKIPISVYFLGVKELITTLYTVYDYTTSGHMDL
jgi:hypothetical protein